MLVDFKDRAFAMNDREFVETFRRLGILPQPDFRYDARSGGVAPQHLGQASRVLEIGPHVRALTGRMIAAGHRLITIDRSSIGTPAGEQCVLALLAELSL